LAGAGFGTSGATMFSVKENNFLGKGIAIDTNCHNNRRSY
jgi:hypothetical protein